MKRWIRMALAGLARNPELMRRWALADQKDRPDPRRRADQ